MKSTTLISVIAISTLTFATVGHTASFAKYDGVDGESKDSKPAPIERQVKKPATETNTSLLLPAVQKVRASSLDKTDNKKKSSKD